MHDVDQHVGKVTGDQLGRHEYGIEPAVGRPEVPALLELRRSDGRHTLPHVVEQHPIRLAPPSRAISPNSCRYNSALPIACLP